MLGPPSSRTRTVASPSPRWIASASAAMRRAEAVHLAQHHDAVADGGLGPVAGWHALAGHRGELDARRLVHAQAPRRRADDVTEHRARLHRGELLGVADEDEPRRRGGTASSNRAINESETMEVSSTTTTSYGSRFSRLWRNRVRLPGLKPSRRCSVTPRECTQPVLHRVVDRHRPRHRCAPPPRGAPPPCPSAPPGRRAVPAPPAASAWASSSASTRATVARLPRPGPPGHHRHAPQDGGGGRHPLEVRARRRRRTARAALRPGLRRPHRARRSPPARAGLPPRHVRRPTGGRGRGSSRPGAAVGPPPPSGWRPAVPAIAPGRARARCRGLRAGRCRCSRWCGSPRGPRRRGRAAVPGPRTPHRASPRRRRPHPGGRGAGPRGRPTSTTRRPR